MAKSVPAFSLKEQWHNMKSRVMPRIEALLDAQACIGGPAVADFEQALASFTQSAHAIGCNSGTDALWLALKAFDVKPNSIVLTTPFSFIASSSEIYAHGAHPVFIDIDPDTLNISPSALTVWLEEHTTEKDGLFVHTETGYPVAGILFVNIFGLCADATQLRTIADRYNLWLLEDAAQSIGATHNEKSSGSLADISCFSFYPTKNLSACGDAGGITTNSDMHAERLTRLRNHGRSSHYNYEEHGINSRLDGLQAVILDEKLKVLPELLTQRKAIAHRYNNAFAELPGVQLPANESEHTYHQYTLLVDESVIGKTRDQVVEQLNTAGIGTRIFYPDLLCDIPYLQTDARLYTQCPIARKTVSSMFSLPMWPEMSDDDVTAVISAVTAVLHSSDFSTASATESTRT